MATECCGLIVAHVLLLTAHMHKVERRNKDFERIDQRLGLYPHRRRTQFTGLAAKLASHRFDHVFWFGVRCADVLAMLPLRRC